MLYVQRTNPLWTSCSVGGGPPPRGVEGEKSTFLLSIVISSPPETPDETDRRHVVDG